MKPTVHIQDPIFGLGQMKTPILEVYHHISPYTVSLFSVFPFFFFFFLYHLHSNSCHFDFFQNPTPRLERSAEIMVGPIGTFFAYSCFFNFRELPKVRFLHFLQKKSDFQHKWTKIPQLRFFSRRGTSIFVILGQFSNFLGILEKILFPLFDL